MKEISSPGPDTFITHTGVNGWNGMFSLEISVTAWSKIAHVIEHFFSWVSAGLKNSHFTYNQLNPKGAATSVLRNSVSREIPSYLQIFISEQIDVLPMKMFLYALGVIDHFSIFSKYRCRGCRAYAQLMAKWMYLYTPLYTSWEYQ